MVASPCRLLLHSAFRCVCVMQLVTASIPTCPGVQVGQEEDHLLPSPGPEPHTMQGCSGPVQGSTVLASTLLEPQSRFAAAVARLGMHMLQPLPELLILCHTEG